MKALLVCLLIGSTFYSNEFSFETLDDKAFNLNFESDSENYFNSNHHNKVDTMKIPFHTIPDYPSDFSSGNILGRMVDGLGYRYYWATHDLRDEDLTYKLALSMNQKRIINIDDQQTNKEYHIAWGKCSKEGRNNGNNKANSKLYKKNYNSAILPAIFRGLGKHTNKPKSLQQLHDMASFSYVIEDTEGCKEGRKYFDERNMRITKNIATQVIQSKKQKNIVIIGAAHVVGLQKEFKEKYPNLKIILMNEY